MQIELFEDDEFNFATPATFNHFAKAMRHAQLDMRNAHIRFAVCRSLHSTDKRNAANAHSEMFWIAARWIAGEY